MNTTPQTNDELFSLIKQIAETEGFVAVGCAKAQRLDEEIVRYKQMQQSGFFGKMEYMSRNEEKRFDPTLLVEGAKSVLVFLSPFEYRGSSSQTADSKEEVSSKDIFDFDSKRFNASDESPSSLSNTPNSIATLKISEYAFGTDYHKVIKDKLYKIASIIESFATGEELHEKQQSKRKFGYSRVFTDSAPVMERAWAVRAGLGFIGFNNFLISRNYGVKNFISVIITKVELPYSKFDSSEQSFHSDFCSKCRRCINSCSQNALFAPHKIDARKCLSYKTIEEKLDGSDSVLSDKCCEAEIGKAKWIFGCDDCMNACPWNKYNHDGWSAFHTNAALLDGSKSKEWWLSLSQEEFDTLFANSPLQRAGLQKIKANILLPPSP